MMAHHHWFRIMTLTLSALASVKLFAILAVLFQLLGYRFALSEKL